jgi:membrane protease YdiL (CAAX protease family)
MPEDPAERQLLAQQPAFSMFALLLFLQLTLAAVLQIADVSFGLIFTELFFFAGPVILWSVASNFRPRALLRLGRPSGVLLALGLIIGAVNFLASGALQALVRALMPAELVSRFDALQLFQEIAGLDLVLLLLAVQLFAPVCEEMAFRGYLQTVLRSRMKDATAILVTAALFAALHFDPVGFLARVELGAIFGLLVLWSGTIWPAVAAHAANNIIGSTLLLEAAQRRGAPADEGITPLSTFLLGAGSALTTLLCLWAFRERAQASPDPGGSPVQPMDPVQDHAFALRRARKAGLIYIASALAMLAILIGLRELGILENRR